MAAYSKLWNIFHLQCVGCVWGLRECV